MKYWTLIKKNTLIILGLILQMSWVYGFLYYTINNSYNKYLKGGVDFLAYYSAGYIFRFLSPNRIYDLSLQRTIQDTIYPVSTLPRFYPFNHPPILAPLLGWAAIDNYNISYLRWIGILIIFHLISLQLLLNILNLLKWEKINILNISVSMLFFSPVIVSLLRSQDSTFLLLTISIFVYGIIFSKDKVAGLGLALAMIRPQIALALAIPFIFKRRKVWWWFLIWGCFLFIFSFLILGINGFNDLINVLIFSGSGLGFDVDRMATLMGFILRFYPSIQPKVFHLLGYLGYFLSILSICILWIKTQVIEIKQISISILLTMIFVPHLHSHDYVLFLLPLLGLVTFLYTQKILSQESCVLIIIGCSLILILYELILFTTTIYFLFLLLFVGFLFDWLSILQRYRKYRS